MATKIEKIIHERVERERVEYCDGIPDTVHFTWTNGEYRTMPLRVDRNEDVYFQSEGFWLTLDEIAEVRSVAKYLREMHLEEAE